MKYIEGLILEINQVTLLSDDLKVKEIVINRDFFVSDEDDLNDFSNDVAQELKQTFDIFFKKNKNWRENYFSIKEKIELICSIISFKLLKKNSNDLNKISDFDFKNYILNDDSSCFRLLINNQYDKSFKKELEKCISNNGILSYKYAKKINERFILGEKEILELGPNIVNDYKDSFIGIRWKEYEDYLVEMKESGILFTYLKDYEINDPSFEDFFKTEGKSYLYSYYESVLKKDKDFFLSKPDLVFSYLVNNISTDDDNIEKIKIKYQGFFDELIKYPELCYKFIEYFQILQNDLEPYISMSPYWSYEYAKYIVFYGHENFKDINPLIISSIKKYPKLYNKLLEVNRFRDDSGYDFRDIDNFKPEDFNEISFLKQSGF